MLSTLRTLAVTSVLILGLAACATPPITPTTATAPSVAPVASSNASASGGVVGFGTGPQAPAATAIPTADTGPTAHAAAQERALEVMELFARPMLSAQRWLADLKPVSTVEFIKENAHIDPKNVPVFTVQTVGEWSMNPGNPYTVQVPVTTTTGVYTVQLHRAGAQAPWLVRYIFPPTLRPNP